MENEVEKQDRATAIIRWTARTIGSIVALFWVLIAIVAGISETSGLTLEGFIIAIMVTGNTIGVITSWVNERRGGLITLLFGIAFSTFALFSAGHNHALAMLTSGGPFILVGTLLLIAHSRSVKVNPA